MLENLKENSYLVENIDKLIKLPKGADIDLKLSN